MTSHLGDFFSQRQEPGLTGLPVMSVTMNDSLVLRDGLDRRLESALRPEQHLLVRKGDIAYNMMRMWQGACGLAASDGVVSPAYVVLAPKPSIDSRFAYHWFKSDRMIYLFWAYSHGLTEDRLRLYFDEFAEIPASPPDLDQQRRIADVLDVWDQAIEQTERIVVAMKAAYRAEIDRVTLELPHTMCRMDAVCTSNVRSLPADTHPDFEFNYFDISAADDGTQQAFSGRLSFKDAPSRARRMVATHGVVYSTVRPLLRRLFVATRRDDTVYSTGYSILEPKECCLAGYLKHVLVSNAVERQIYARLTGSGYPAISEKDLAEVLIPLPSRDLQGKLCDTLDGIDRQQSLYASYSNTLRAQKRGLMQRLFGGTYQLDAQFDLRTLAPKAAFAAGLPDQEAE